MSNLRLKKLLFAILPLLMALTLIATLVSCDLSDVDTNNGSNPDSDNEDKDSAEIKDTDIFTKKQAVLLLGQSNMAGRGDVTTVEPISDSRITMLRNGSWVPMQEPIHDDKPSLAGVCLAASFAKAFVEKFDCELGLIPGAFGGTSLEDWTVGGSYYNRALDMARAAQQDSEICAILWHQGESDQRNAQYAQQLRVILDCFIKDLGLDSGEIVIITGELGEFRSSSADTVNNALKSLSDKYANYAVASSAGLTAQDVDVHFDAASLRVFGYRYFAHFYKIKTGKTYTFNEDPQSYLIAPGASDETDG
ncbi:MAG: sialate O-acetylesterase [Clostridia bacterium]|nr:sialate O-acetylesterase [Clostridia bacterium]